MMFGIAIEGWMGRWMDRWIEGSNGLQRHLTMEGASVRPTQHPPLIVFIRLATI